MRTDGFGDLPSASLHIDCRRRGSVVVHAQARRERPAVDDVNFVNQRSRCQIARQTVRAAVVTARQEVRQVKRQCLVRIETISIAVHIALVATCHTCDYTHVCMY